jgi:ribosome-binding protein aMBF1 (putative translation factor)
MTNLPKPLAVTKETVLISRTAWKRIAEALEDAGDHAAVRASKARMSRNEDDALPIAFYRRIRSGEHPIRVWRDYRGLGLNELAARAKVARGYLSEIETGKKPGSVAALKRVADALNIALDDALPVAARGKRAG